jgi:(heptosyl)LPS beta-1,4-glucosyltransferase
VTRTALDAVGASSPGLRFRLILPALAAILLCLFAPPAGAVAAIGAAAILACLFRRPGEYDPGAPEKLLFFAGVFYVLVWWLAAAAHWHLQAGVFAGLAALLLIYPLHRAGLSWRFDDRTLWRALSGACLAAAIAAAAALAAGGPVIGQSAIWWGNIAFALGAMTLSGLDRPAGRSTRTAMLATAVVGMMAGLVSGSWGVWLALPVVLTVWFFHLPNRLSPRFRWASVLAVLIGVEIVLLIDTTGALVRFRWLVLQANVWWHSDGQAGLFGVVLHDWAAALTTFAAHPLIGAVTDGSAGDLNQYVLTLRDSGLVGALALALLIGVPGWFFAHAGRHRDPAVQRVGRAGVLLVTAYSVVALLQPVFASDRMLVFYAFAVAALYAVARQARTAALAQPVARRQSLSVIVITRNEADRIGRCLESAAGWADEIVVLDSGSTDDTAAIARRYTDRVEVTDWPGFGVQKQRALERASCDWVLSLDADEALTPALRHEIDTTLSETPECAAYRVPWAVTINGKRLDFGRSRAPLRLTRRDGARYTTDIVHERIIPPGKVGRLENRLLHYTWRSYGHALQKSADYAWLGAKRRHDRGRRGGGLPVAALRSVWVFCQTYFLRLGLLDGGIGFLIAVVDMQDSFNKYAGLWALRQGDKKK